MSYIFSEMPNGFGWLPDSRGKRYFVVKIGPNVTYYQSGHYIKDVKLHYYNCDGKPFPKGHYPFFYIPEGLI